MRNDDNQDEYEIKAMLGYYNPTDEQSIMCTCGWQGTIAECLKNDFSNDGWNRLSGRKGYFWHCPTCNEIVWRYYHTVS